MFYVMSGHTHLARTLRTPFTVLGRLALQVWVLQTSCLDHLHTLAMYSSSFYCPQLELIHVQLHAVIASLPDSTVRASADGYPPHSPELLPESDMR
jgi:hypothetical protein